MDGLGFLNEILPLLRCVGGEGEPLYVVVGGNARGIVDVKGDEPGYVVEDGGNKGVGAVMVAGGGDMPMGGEDSGGDVGGCVGKARQEIKPAVAHGNSNVVEGGVVGDVGERDMEIGRIPALAADN